MTHSAAAPPRKPRRLGLYLPWGIALALVVVWSGWWLWLSGETERRMDAAAAAERAHGGEASWSSRRVGGYPFRIDVDLANVRLADPSGWSIALPTLRGEAYAFAPGHWIVGTTDGATITAPGGRPVTVASPQLRASLTGWDRRPPRISFVGDDLAFAVPPGAAPFPLARAKDVQLYTRAGPQDQGALFIEVDGGAAAPGTDLAALADGQPVSLTVDAVLSHAGALAGPGWRAAVTGWSRRGGAIAVQHIVFAAGAVSLTISNGRFGVGPDGDVDGAADAALEMGGGGVQARLDSRDGALWLSFARPGGAPQRPVRLAPAPHVF